ncbi:isochorismatase family protein [Staphylococcus aureus]|nr:isochorismatase family protein [Staphylococcus aureus]
MSHLALKDLFSGFFVIDDEEEVEVPDKQQQVNEAPAKEQSQQTTKQNAIKSVPQKSASRYTTTSEERNNRMSNYSKNNSRRGIDTIVLGGVATHIGVDTTARDAYQLNYNQFFVTDMMSAQNETLHQFPIDNVFPLMGQTITTNDFLNILN